MVKWVTNVLIDVVISEQAIPLFVPVHAAANIFCALHHLYNEGYWIQVRWGVTYIHRLVDKVAGNSTVPCGLSHRKEKVTWSGAKGGHRYCVSYVYGRQPCVVLCLS